MVTRAVRDREYRPQSRPIMHRVVRRQPSSLIKKDLSNRAVSTKVIEPLGGKELPSWKACSINYLSFSALAE